MINWVARLLYLRRSAAARGGPESLTSSMWCTSALPLGMATTALLRVLRRPSSVAALRLVSVVILGVWLVVSGGIYAWRFVVRFEYWRFGVLAKVLVQTVCFGSFCSSIVQWRHGRVLGYSCTCSFSVLEKYWGVFRWYEDYIFSVYVLHSIRFDSLWSFC